MNLNLVDFLRRIFGIPAAPIGCLLAALLLVASLFFTGPNRRLQERAPGADTSTVPVVPYAGPPQLKGHLTRGSGVPANITGAWPQFRGAKSDGISADITPLLRNWGAEGPRVLWSIDVGEGYAGAAIAAGRVYLLDYDHAEEADVLRCISLADGKDIWRFSYPVKVKRNHGMSRTVPAVTEKYVVSLGPKCHVTCCDAKTGEMRWAIDLVHDYHTTVPQWYTGQCPLIDGDRAVLAPGGEAIMIAVDCTTGEVVWKTPNPRRWQMSHSSIIPMTFHGKRMYVYCAQGGVVGVSAADGSLLWETDAWKIPIATVPSPVEVGEGKIFLSGGYDAGSMLLQLRQSGKKIIATPLFRLKPAVFGAALQTPVFYKGKVYGVRPDGQMVCLDLNGKVLWSSGSQNRFGLGPFLVANGLLFAMNDTGVLTLMEATPSGYRQLARAKVLVGPDAWGPMAFVGGRLIVRDLTKMVCLDLRRQG